MYKFLKFFTFVGGLSVMFYPTDVFISTVVISIHTMVWHTSMVVIGFYLIFSRKYCEKIKKDGTSFIVFQLFSLY